jgi:hypothetical protein
MTDVTGIGRVKEAATTETKEKPEEPTVPPVPFLRLFRYSTGHERFLLSVAVLCAIAQGASWSVPDDVMILHLIARL